MIYTITTRIITSNNGSGWEPLQIIKIIMKPVCTTGRQNPSFSRLPRDLLVRLLLAHVFLLLAPAHHCLRRPRSPVHSAWQEMPSPVTRAIRSADGGGGVALFQEQGAS